MGLWMFTVASVLAVAGAASAAGPRLLLTSPAGPTPGAPYSGENWVSVFFGPNDEGAVCSQLYQGNVDNDKKMLVDNLEGSVPESSFTFCKAGYSMTFGLTRLALSWNGQVRTHGATVFRKPGPCVYRFSHLAAAFTPGTFLQATGTALGYLVGSESDVLTCRYVETMPLLVDVTYPQLLDGGGIQILNTELRS
jgi:hypothetical protein